MTLLARARLLIARVWSLRNAATLWLWSHRTKVMGGVGMAAAYSYEHQEQLGLFIPAKSMAHTMMAVGLVTFVIGLYNTLHKEPE